MNWVQTGSSLVLLPATQQQPRPVAQQQPGPHPAAQQQPGPRPASKDLPLPDDQQPSTPEDDSPSWSGEGRLTIDSDVESEYSSESDIEDEKYYESVSESPGSDSSSDSLTADQRVGMPLYSPPESHSGSLSPTPDCLDPPSEAQGEAPFEVSKKKRPASRNLNEIEKRANLETK